MVPASNFLQWPLLLHFSMALKTPDSSRNKRVPSIFVQRTIFPGFIKLSGSKASLTCSKAWVMRSPNCHCTHSLRTKPSPCSPENAPLYLRTSHKADCDFASVICTTEPGRPRSPISSSSARNFSSKGACISPANSTNNNASVSWPCTRVNAVSITGANSGLARESSIMVRSTSSTATGPSFTICCVNAMAW